MSVYTSFEDASKRALLDLALAMKELALFKTDADRLRLNKLLTTIRNGYVKKNDLFWMLQSAAKAKSRIPVFIPRLQEIKNAFRAEDHNYFITHSGAFIDSYAASYDDPYESEGPVNAASKSLKNSAKRTGAKGSNRKVGGYDNRELKLRPDAVGEKLPTLSLRKQNKLESAQMQTSTVEVSSISTDKPSYNFEKFLEKYSS